MTDSGVTKRKTRSSRAGLSWAVGPVQRLLEEELGIVSYQPVKQQKGGAALDEVTNDTDKSAKKKKASRAEHSVFHVSGTAPVFLAAMQEQFANEVLMACRDRMLAHGQRRLKPEHLQEAIQFNPSIGRLLGFDTMVLEAAAAPVQAEERRSARKRRRLERLRSVDKATLYRNEIDADQLAALPSEDQVSDSDEEEEAAALEPLPPKAKKQKKKPKEKGAE